MAKKDAKPEMKDDATFLAIRTGNVGFTPLQRLFVDYYTGSFTKAYEEMTRDGIDITIDEAKYISTLPSVKLAIRTRDKMLSTIADKKARQAFWSKVMADEAEDMKNRLKASELLGKSEKDFIEKVEHSLEADFAKVLLEARKRHQKMTGVVEVTTVTEDPKPHVSKGFRSMLE